LSKVTETSNYTVFPSPSVVVLKELTMSKEEEHVAKMLRDLRDSIPEDIMKRFSHIISEHGFVLVQQQLLEKVVNKIHLPMITKFHVDPHSKLG